MGKETKGAWGAVSALAAVGLIAYLYIYSGVGSNISAECSINGTGSGQCQITNTGWTAGTACPSIGLKNKNSGLTVRTKICSGIVWPQDTVQKEISISIPVGHCSNPSGDWTSTCELKIENATDDTEAASSLEALPQDEARQIFNPIKAKEQITQGRCHMGECSWAKWISVRNAGRTQENLLLEVELLEGSSSHEGDYPKSPHGVPIVWSKAPHIVRVACSKTSPSVDGERLPLSPDGMYGALESSAEIYFEACHSHADGYPSGIEKYHYNVIN